MNLNIYGLKDDVTGEFIFFFQQQNEGCMKRVVKSCLLTKEPNAFTTDMKDKAVYELGSVNTNNGEIKGQLPVFCCRVSEIRLELIKEIKIAKAEAGEEKPEAPEVASDE